MSETAIAKKEERAPVGMDERGVSLRSMDDLARFSVAVAKSALAPRGLDTAEKIMVAVQTGMEAGLSPMAAMRSLYVVGGMPAWYGKAAKALILNSGRCKGWNQGHTGDGEKRVAWVESDRDGFGIKRTEFSVTEAKRMKLWGKSGPWSDDPDSMLMWRAIGRHAAQWYQDVLMGLAIVEEVVDYRPHTTNGDTRAALPPPEDSDPLLDAAPEKVAYPIADDRAEPPPLFDADPQHD